VSYVGVAHKTTTLFIPKFNFQPVVSMPAIKSFDLDQIFAGR